MSFREPISAELRKNIIKEQKNWCAVCEIRKITEIHHIIPVVSGGHSNRENLVGLCSLCHWAVPGEYPDGYIDEFEIYKKAGGPEFRFVLAFFIAGYHLAEEKKGLHTLKVIREFDRMKKIMVKALQKR